MTTWLTRITPGPRSTAAHGDLRDSVRMHQRVMMLVPDGLGDEARRRAGLLYRVEEGPAGLQVLVQTQVPPDPGRLPAGYGATAVRDLTPLLDWLRPGAPVRYRLAANTIRRMNHTGKPVPLRGAAADDWWADRAREVCGLDLLMLSSRALPDAVGGWADSKREIRHVVTQFDGTAIVADADLLAEAVVTGVGRGKAYGCGLLSIMSAG